MLKLMNHTRNDAKTVPPPNLQCLSFPIGLTQGSLNQRSIKTDASADLVSSTCCHYAYAFSFIQPPTTWKPEDINRILLESQSNIESSKTNCDRMEVALTVDHMKQFQISNYNVDIKLPIGSEVIGQIANTNQPGISSARKGLRQFFQRSHHRACVFCADSLKMLIWKTARIFYVFDPIGRRGDFQQDSVNGFASFICLDTLKNLTSLIVHLSGLKPDDFFVLKEIHVNTLTKARANKLKYMARKTKPADPTKSQSVPDSTFVTISERMAILNGSMNVSNDCFKESRNCQTLTSCCVAYIYSLIHPPNIWTQTTVDKVLLFGNQLYQECVNGRIPEQFTISHVPTVVSLGPYRAGIDIRPYHSGGRLQHTVDPSSSELVKVMTQYFVDKSSALLQVDQMHFAVWKRGCVFYLFDPYGRNQFDGPSKSGVASLQIHSTLESMSSSLYAVLIRIAEKERFYLHELIGSILSGESGGTNVHQMGDEKMSLNESVASFYTPKLVCKSQQEPNVKSVCNLDSPTVSATQFIRPWQVIKGDAFRAAGPAVVGELGTGEALEEMEDDDGEEGGPNNELGIDNDVFDTLLALGLTEDQIADYQALGLSIDDIIKWASQGLQPDEVKRLIEAGITVEEFDEIKKLNLSIDECIQSKEMGIPPDTFANMKEAGVEPKHMEAALAAEQAELEAAAEAQENQDKFKELGLNTSEMDKMTDMGISADTFANATKTLGLSFEDIANATKYGITLDEFARLKALGMSPVEIIRMHELNLTPEQYFKLKELGQTPENMEEISRSGMTVDEYIAKLIDCRNQPETGNVDNEDITGEEDEIKVKTEEEIKVETKEEIKVETEEECETSNQEIKPHEGVNDEEKRSQSVKSEEKIRVGSREHQASLSVVPVSSSTTNSPPIGASLDTGTTKQKRSKSDSISIVITEKDSKLRPTIVDAHKELEACDTETSVGPVQKTSLETKEKTSNMAVIRSAAMTPISFQILFDESFKLVDRVLIMNSKDEPNCVALQDKHGSPDQQYYLYEGCDCSIHYIRRLVIADSKECLTAFQTMDQMIECIIKKLKASTKQRSVAKASNKKQGPEKQRKADGSTNKISKITTSGDRPKSSAQTDESSDSNYVRNFVDDQLRNLDKRFDELLAKWHALSLQNN